MNILSPKNLIFAHKGQQAPHPTHVAVYDRVYSGHLGTCRRFASGFYVGGDLAARGCQVTTHIKTACKAP